MTIQPIWKTIEVDMTSELDGGSVEFSVSTGGVTIYEGRAYADADGNCIVRLNNILRDYLGGVDINPATLAYADARTIMTFTVAYGEDGSESFKVINDWSYDPAREYDDEEDTFLTDAVSHWDYRVPRPVTIFGDFEAVVNYYNGDGEMIHEDIIPIDGHSVTVMLRPTVPGRVDINLDSDTLRLTCGEFCDAATLLYRNKVGGYDLLPIASLVENESYSRDTYDKDGSSASPALHLRSDYHNAVTRSYTLRTPVLREAQAAKMANALGSVQAWLHTPERGFEAVIIRAEGWKRKTFKNEGRKRISYEFTVEFAQSMERR